MSLSSEFGMWPRFNQTLKFSPIHVINEIPLVGMPALGDISA